MSSPRIPTPAQRVLIAEPCFLEERKESPSGWWCLTHEIYVSENAIRCGILIDIEMTRGLLLALDLAVEALQEVHDHYFPGSPGNDDTPSSAWTEARDTLLKIGVTP